MAASDFSRARCPSATHAVLRRGVIAQHRSNDAAPQSAVPVHQAGHGLISAAAAMPDSSAEMTAAEAVAVPVPLADNDRLYEVFGMGQVGRVLAVMFAGRGFTVRVVSRHRSTGLADGIGWRAVDATDPEVEHALAAHRAVEEVAVFGVPDPRWGESVYAVVFGRMQVAPDELVARCRARVAGFEVPRFVELRAGLLPESAAGKILKRDLRGPHWAGQRAHVSGG